MKRRRTPGAALPAQRENAVLRWSRSGVPLLLAAAAACSPADSSPPPATAERDTLPDGTVRVRYGPLPDDAALPVEPDLRIGALQGDPQLTFGDVRGVEADAEGTIYVLDYQASEVRAFDEGGRFLRVVAGKGEGPGELTEANGMAFSDDGTLWIQDHAKMVMIGVTRDGEEAGSVPMHVRSYGYIWNGAVDDRGRFWKPLSHSDAPRTYPPEEGLNESRARLYLSRYDPATGTTDSVHVGESTYRAFVSRTAGGWSYRSIPFTPGPITAVDPAGGFWQADAEAHRVARRGEGGDTVLVIEADVEPGSVTAADRTRYVEDAVAERPESRRAAERIAELMPPIKPVLASLGVDDEGRLWVGQVVPEEASPLYDVFTRDGTFVGSLRLRFDPSPYLPVKIRDGRLYTIVSDSLDVPYVVRAELPRFGRER